MAIDINTIYIALGLIIAFTIAFKVMEMVLEVALVSGLSGAFYVVASQAFGWPLTINNVALFTLAGTSAYVIYSVVYAAFRTASSIAEIPSAIGGFLLERLRPGSRIKEWIRRKREDRVKTDKEENSSGEDQVKRVVIDKVSEQSEDDDDDDDVEEVQL